MVASIASRSAFPPELSIKWGHADIPASRSFSLSVHAKH